MKNIEFIPASSLPTTEAEEVDVLCVENGELKRKAGATLGSGGGGSMEVDIVLSDSNFYSGTATFSKTYDEIKSAIDNGYFVIGWLRQNQFKGDVYYHYSPGYMRPTFPKYAPHINGGTIFFISSNNEVASVYIQADGTTGLYFD